jgi:hypothetical protein
MTERNIIVSFYISIKIAHGTTYTYAVEVELAKVPLESMIADLLPAAKGPRTVLLRPTETYSECRSWVVSRRLAKSYIELVPTSEFGTTTDIRRTLGQEHMIDSVLLGSANS